MTETDAELVERVRRGDETAFHTIVDRYAAILYRLAVVMVNNVTDAEDIVQETLTGAYISFPRFEGRASLKTWLTRILMKQVARHRRYWRLRRATSIDAMRDETGDAFEAGVGAVTPESTGARLDLQTMLAALSPEHRQVLVLREVEGFSYTEIAEAMGVPMGTVESRLYRARHELRRRFGEFLPSGPEAEKGRVLGRGGIT